MLSKASVLTVGILAAACSGRPSSDIPRGPTFARDVAPIVYAQCATCHRPGEAGPFPLLTYADVKGRARQIADVTRTRYMPPWKPEPGHGEFVGERRLAERQIALIQQWVEAGAPEGDRRDMPAPPSFPEGWQLGTPDLVVAMPGPIAVPAEGIDLFRTIIVPVTIDAAKYVRAVEFRPGNARAVHHAMIRVVRPGSRATVKPAVFESEGMLATEEDIVSPDGHVLGWAPGYSPTVAPSGMAWRLDAGSALAIELHLQTTGRPEQVQSAVGLFFANEAAARTPFGLQLGSYTIDIPPGASDYAVEDRYELPVDVEVLAVYPHAHYRGKDVRAAAVLPDGSERTLIWIRDWDFKWQNAYRYRSPVTLPRGTIVRMRYTYDNSASNPRNPASPPTRVRYGGQSVDEMANLWMQVVPVNQDDLPVLKAHYERKSAERQLAGFEVLAREQPDSSAVQRALGAAYLRLGRIDESVAALQEAVRLAPRHVTARYNLGHALAAQRRSSDAIVQFRTAARLQPAFAEAHNNLGILLRQRGDLVGAERALRAAVAAAPDYAPAHNNLGVVQRLRRDPRGAIRSLESAIRIDPQYAEAHLNLGLAFQETGDRAAATRHFRRAMQLDASTPDAYNALAWLLATAPDVTPSAAAEAVALAERAVTLTQGRDASALDTLGAAFAAAGDLPRGVAAAERALQVATSSGQPELAAQIQRRLQAYRSR